MLVGILQRVLYRTDYYREICGAVILLKLLNFRLNASITIWVEFLLLFNHRIDEELGQVTVTYSVVGTIPSKDFTRNFHRFFEFYIICLHNLRTTVHHVNTKTLTFIAPY